MPAGVTVFGARSESTAEAIDEQVRILYQATENSGALPSSRTPSPDPPGSPSVAITLLSTPLLDVCNHYGADTAALAAYLHTIAVDVSTPLPSLGFAGTGGGGSNYLLIKASYRERDRTASFRCRAMRESRHTILLWAPSESRWYIVASQFVRGAESLTRQTQVDLHVERNSILEEQRKICNIIYIYMCVCYSSNAHVGMLTVNSRPFAAHSLAPALLPYPLTTLTLHPLYLASFYYYMHTAASNICTRVGGQHSD